MKRSDEYSFLLDTGKKCLKVPEPMVSVEMVVESAIRNSQSAMGNFPFIPHSEFPISHSKGSALTTRTKYFVVALLYFSEGLPFGLINNLLSVYFRVKKISLEEIGLLSLLGLAWSLKILWAPLVDRFGRRYWWIFPPS